MSGLCEGGDEMTVVVRYGDGRPQFVSAIMTQAECKQMVQLLVGQSPEIVSDEADRALKQQMTGFEVKNGAL